MAGIQSRNYFSPKVKGSPTQAAYDTYGTAARQQGQDYSDIMNKFNDVYNTAGGSGGGNLNLNYDYTVPSYQTTSDYTRSVGNLRNASERGLYSDEDVSNLRERGISPIRSVYANAQRNVGRQRALQGGYSPNYTAVSAKMAREMSSQLSDATTKVNAQIAQDIAAQKANAQSQYASVASGEQAERNRFALGAADMGNRYGLDKLDAQMKSYQIPMQMKLSALQGMTGLYGTTPAITSLMQSGALNQANMQGMFNQNDFNNKSRVLSMFGG